MKPGHVTGAVRVTHVNEGVFDFYTLLHTRLVGGFLLCGVHALLILYLGSASTRPPTHTQTQRSDMSYGRNIALIYFN